MPRSPRKPSLPPSSHAFVLPCSRCRYNYFFRQGTVRVQTAMIGGGILYGTYLVMFGESQR
jgi:hypothetical protein